MTVPADIKPNEVELAAIALLLRAGIYRQDVPTYDPPARPADMPFAWRRLWGRLHVR